MEKKLHSSRENVRYMLHNWWEWDKKSIWFCILRVPALVLMPMLTALIPKLMIDCITAKASMLSMVVLIAAMSALIAALSWIDPFLQGKMNGVSQAAAIRYSILTFRKAMTADYENMESLEGREKFERGRGFALYGRYSGSQDFYEIIVSLCANATGIVSYLAVLSALRPAMILLIAATCIGEFLLVRYTAKAELQTRQKNNPLWVRFDYLYQNAHNFAAGKDIRLYGAGDWLLFILAQLTASFTKVIGKYTRQVFASSSGRALLSLLREAVAYVYLIGCVLSGTMGVSDFIFYFGIITGFAAWILGITQQLQNLDMVATECDHFRAFLEMPDRAELQSSHPLPSQEELPCSIAFENVDFRYQGGKGLTLKQMSFTVNPGEKIAIVGENGAGKTTCIKILCGFYQPTAGRVLVNGVPTDEYGRDAYYSLFSAVYQDYHFLPMSIERNVCLCEEEDIDHEKLEHVLRQAGIWERIEQLPEKGKTKMVKQVFENAVNLSGGEQQKLLLARALYRDAPILVLDEPTAALDPIAENELYQQYNELTTHKTSFFISHRLSSTRFCDRILFISDGRIAEMGTHEELMEKKGAYWRMFQIQSHYYKEENNAQGMREEAAR